MHTPFSLRLANIGLLAGLVAGFLVAVGARINMRLVTLVDNSSPTDIRGFTSDTVALLVVVSLAAVKGGLLYVLLKRWLPGSITWSGLTFGVLILLFPGVPMMMFDEAFSIGPALLTWPLFGILFVAYGFAVAALVRGLETV